MGTKFPEGVQKLLEEKVKYYRGQAKRVRDSGVAADQRWGEPEHPNAPEDQGIGRRAASARVQRRRLLVPSTPGISVRANQTNRLGDGHPQRAYRAAPSAAHVQLGDQPVQADVLPERDGQNLEEKKNYWDKDDSSATP